MSDQDTEALADLLLGTTKALEIICRQLIDANLLNAEILIADLVQAQVEVSKTAGPFASVPAALAASLGAKSPRNEP